ncbi:MAG: AAA family ATPase, partial [Pseudomonadales bacterium]
MFKKAERKQAKLRLALAGPSGAGKTYSALLIAKGIGGKIAVLDTEKGSASLYSDLVDFDVVDLTAPFTPERYIEVIAAAEAAGYD